MNATTTAIPADKINTSVINSNWWNQFLTTTNHFTETSVINNAIPDTECEELKGMVAKAIQEICRAKTDKYGFRVFADGIRVKGEDLEKSVFPQPPLPGEELDEWGARLFPDKKFGMIINSGEKFSNELAKRLAVYAAPLLEKVGIPLNGLHSTIFVGNYGLTPLGIHQDHRGANVIHFHLGPGGKTMYTWNEQRFTELLAGRKKSEVPIEELLPHANQFPFGKGDIYFMPWNQFHIGNAGEFSIGVTLWFDNHVRKQVLNNLLESVRIQYLNLGDTTITTPEKDFGQLQGYADIDAVLNLEPHLANKTFPDFLKAVYEEYMLSLFSNQGWSTRPLSLLEENGYDENEYSYLSDATVKLAYPFRLLYRHLPDIQKLQIFSRGSKIEFNYHPEIITLIDKLNEGNILPVATLATEVCKELPGEVALYILSLFINNRSVEIVAS